MFDSKQATLPPVSPGWGSHKKSADVALNVLILPKKLGRSPSLPSSLDPTSLFRERPFIIVSTEKEGDEREKDLVNSCEKFQTTTPSV